MRVENQADLTNRMALFAHFLGIILVCTPHFRAILAPWHSDGPLDFLLPYIFNAFLNMITAMMTR